MIATPSDWARIACELMLASAGRSDTMLSQESVRAMFRTEADLNPAEFEGISGQGLGVFLFSKGQQQYFLHHGHNSPGANCVLIGSQTTGQGAVIMANGMRGIPLSYQIVSSISREYGWDKDHAPRMSVVWGTGIRLRRGLPAAPSASGFAFGYAVTSRRDKSP